MGHFVSSIVGDAVLRANKNVRTKRVVKRIMNMVPSGTNALVDQWVEEARIRESYRTKYVPEQELERRYEDALRYLIDNHGADSIGDYFEFGVCHGTSTICLYKALRNLGLDDVRLIGFDSFEGLPETAAVDDGGTWQPGEFKSEYEFTYSNLSKHGVDMSRVVLVKGFYSDTLNAQVVDEHQLENTSIVMVDCDLYLSAKEALTFIAPLIRDRAFIFFDDWDARQGQLAEKNLGERKAFEEFLEENPDLGAEEFEALKYRTADPTYEAYSRVFLVTRMSS